MISLCMGRLGKTNAIKEKQRNTATHLLTFAPRFLFLLLQSPAPHGLQLCYLLLGLCTGLMRTEGSFLVEGQVRAMCPLPPHLKQRMGCLGALTGAALGASFCPWTTKLWSLATCSVRLLINDIASARACCSATISAVGCLRAGAALEVWSNQTGQSGHLLRQALDGR